jgi:hypothetical protein
MNINSLKNNQNSPRQSRVQSRLQSPRQSRVQSRLQSPRQSHSANKLNKTCFDIILNLIKSNHVLFNLLFNLFINNKLNEYNQKINIFFKSINDKFICNVTDFNQTLELYFIYLINEYKKEDGEKIFRKNKTHPNNSPPPDNFELQIIDTDSLIQLLYSYYLKKMKNLLIDKQNELNKLINSGSLVNEDKDQIEKIINEITKVKNEINELIKEEIDNIKKAKNHLFLTHI